MGLGFVVGFFGLGVVALFQLVEVDYLLLVKIVFSEFIIVTFGVELVAINSEAVQELKARQFSEDQVDLVLLGEVDEERLQTGFWFVVTCLAYLAQLIHYFGKCILVLGDLVVVQIDRFESRKVLPELRRQ